MNSETGNEHSGGMALLPCHRETSSKVGGMYLPT